LLYHEESLPYIYYKFLLLFVVAPKIQTNKRERAAVAAAVRRVAIVVMCVAE
jgi:hypothetical protein